MDPDPRREEASRHLFERMITAYKRSDGDIVGTGELIRERTGSAPYRTVNRLGWVPYLDLNRFGVPQGGLRCMTAHRARVAVVWRSHNNGERYFFLLDSEGKSWIDVTGHERLVSILIDG